MPFPRFQSIYTLLLISAAGLASAADPGKVDFNYDIRPIISSKCYHCHGPDEASRKAKLRLDIRDEALKEREGVRAIVPGDLNESDLVVRILSHDKDEVMPPPKEGEPLTPKEIELLRKWVEQGAEYKEHWAWSKPVAHAIPKIDLPGVVTRNPIDAFIVERVARAGLSQSPEADRHTLIRRLSLDLIGLPPTPAEVEDFVKDSRPDWYERAVDRLLASPHFGERWARMWLDLARYADSTGYGSDKFRLNIWPYRDWVINAFNRNLPYDQFTIEQLAGDLLPNPTPDQIVATAFHRNTMTNVEGGTIDEEYRVAAVKDRVATTGQTWMGLTFGCAQCHSHKFDPISQKEYYQLFAVLNQTEDSDREDEEPKLALPTEEERRNMARLSGEIGTLEKQMTETSSEFEAEMHEWEATVHEAIPWTVLVPTEARAGTINLSVEGDGSVVGTNISAPESTYTIKAPVSTGPITALRIEALADDRLPSKGPGRADNGNGVLSEVQVTVMKRVQTPLAARYVRVELPGNKKILSLAEVQVISGAENVAAKGKASQSGTDFEGAAELAIDGNTDGDFAHSKSVTHSRTEKDPWWELDLQEEMPVTELALWNRTDGDVGKRLKGARVQLLDLKRQVVWERTLAEAPKTSAKFAPAFDRPIALRNPSADFAQDGFGPAQVLDNDGKTGWAFLPKTGESHALVVEFKEPVTVPPDALLAVSLAQEYGGNHTLARVRVSVTSKTAPVREIPKQLREILAIEPSERSEDQRKELVAYFRPLSKTQAALEARLKTKRAELAAIKPVQVPVFRELTADKRRISHLLNKGNYLAPADEVQPALPAAFTAGLQTGGSVDRLTMARWLVNPDNPLTARVTVNRFWAQLFGTGIVESEEDFGTQGALPSHPELLDWLAIQFSSPKGSTPTALGWDVKGLLKLVVTSATYRQSSRVTPEQLSADARNRLLASYPRRRLDAEAVRDQALALAGLLSGKIGGPSVYPPQPDGLWKVAFNGGQNGYPTSKGEDRYRRGIYTFWRRTMPYPSMNTFDAPSRESCTLRRKPTNTPLQAFVTLNDPCFVECAQVLARRIVREGGSDANARLRWALQLALSRPLAEAQVAPLQQLLDDELAHYRSDLESAKKLASSDVQPLPPDQDPAELAAWTVVSNVLLNLDGVLSRN